MFDWLQCIIFALLLYVHSLRYGSLNLYCVDSFCLSLQLEVLHSQAQMLIRERWGDLVQIERYIAGKCLILAVWKYVFTYVYLIRILPTAYILLTLCYR